MTILEIFLTSKASSANYNIKLNRNPTTSSDIGYETFFKVDDKQTKVSGETNHRASLYNCTIKTLIDHDSSSTNGNIIYKVTNYDSKKHSISIATAANLNIARISTKIAELNENKGFSIQTTQHLYYLLEEIGNGKASTIWFGDSKHRFKNLYSNNRIGDTKNPGIAFSWKDKFIEPSETKIFTIGMSLTQNTDFNTEPRIEASILSTGPYYKGFFDDPNHNDNITIQVQIIDNTRQRYKIKCNFNDVGPITMKEVSHSATEPIHTFNFTLKTNSYLFNGTNRMTIYCQDSNGRLSNFVDFDIEAIIEPIKMDISIAKHDSTYECTKDDKLTYSGWLNDFSGFGPVEIVALYNGNYEHVLKEYTFSNGRITFINDEVQIEANGLNEKNTVSIFARNQCSGVSQMFNFTFGYKCRKPILNITVEYKNLELIISGSVGYKDSNVKARCWIYYYFNDDDKNTYCLTYTSNTFDKKMKPNIYDGKHKLYFYALDRHNIKSDIYSKEFTFASTIPIITLSKRIESNISEITNFTLEGQLEYQSNCNMYYNIDNNAFISLGVVDVNQNRKIGSFRFNFSLNEILSEGVHNLTLYAESTTNNQIRSYNITHKFTYFSSRPQIIDFSKPRTISRAKFYFYHQYVTRGNMRWTKKV